MIYVAVVLALILIAALWKIHRFREWHHGYYGAALCFAQPFFGWPVWAAGLGVVLLLDDDVQHVAEAFNLVPRMADFTPIHKLGAWIMGIDLKKLGWAAPIAIILGLAAAAIFAAVHFGV